MAGHTLQQVTTLRNRLQHAEGRRGLTTEPVRVPILRGDQPAEWVKVEGLGNRVGWRRAELDAYLDNAQGMEVLANGLVFLHGNELTTYLLSDSAMRDGPREVTVEGVSILHSASNGDRARTDINLFDDWRGLAVVQYVVETRAADDDALRLLTMQQEASPLNEDWLEGSDAVRGWASAQINGAAGDTTYLANEGRLVHAEEPGVRPRSDDRNTAPKPV